MLKGPRLLPKTGQKPQQLVMLFHGYGSNGQDFLGIGEHWQQLFPQAEFFAPNGLDVCDINPMGYQWFGVKEFSPFLVRSGLDAVRHKLIAGIESALAERSLTPADLVLVGFSQGTMVVLDLMFHIPQLRGVIGYSGAFYPPITTAAKPSCEVLLVHGDADMVVSYVAFTEAIRQLGHFGITPHSHTCPGLGHTIDGVGLRVGADFLHHVWGKPASVIYST